jgi:hypothetical protein
MEKVLIFMIALSLIASATAAETATGTTPAPKEVMAMDCSKMTDAAAKKDCEAKAQKDASTTNTAPASK